MTLKSNFGLRRLIDQQLRFKGPGTPAWLRIKNFVDPRDVTEMGFQYTPPVTGTQQVGFTDIPIQPTPVIKTISMHNIAMAVAAGVMLRSGSREVMISHTWVKQQMGVRNFDNPLQVFKDATVIGIVTETFLLGIESVYPDYAFGQEVAWYVQGNYNELK